MKCDAAARPITLLLSAIGSTSAPYNQVVLLSMPSMNVSQILEVRRYARTVRDDEEVDAEYRKPFADFVGRVLKLQLHDRCVDLDDYDAAQSCQDHSMTTSEWIRRVTGLLPTFFDPIGQSDTWW